MAENGHDPNIRDYAFISDCHSAALISARGTIDWCCMPRFDSASCFGRMLDLENGGHCSVLGDDLRFSNEYIPGTLILKTSIFAPTGEAELYDFFAVREGGRTDPLHQLIRLVRCTSGHISLGFEIRPRFDYGSLEPWIRKEDINCFSAIGGDDALVIQADKDLVMGEHSLLTCRFSLAAGEAARLSIRYMEPAVLEYRKQYSMDCDSIDELLQQTKQWWLEWSDQMHYKGADHASILRSAVVLKGMFYAPTGAIIAAPTTSLPERIGGDRNWDYRYSWIRDSVFSARALADIGFMAEPDRFRRFIQRSSASSAATLQIMYGIRGNRRLSEIEMPKLSGYKNSQPVRIGNEAYRQKQLDCYGLLLQLVWKWHERGRSPDDDLWRFLVNVVDEVCEIWNRPDQGIWESRGKPQHYVHSKVMCWAAVDFGIRLADDCMRKAPLRRWRAVRKEIRDQIMDKGVDKKRGCFVQAYGTKKMDASLTLIPQTSFIEPTHPIMMATSDAIMQDLDYMGYIRRYDTDATNDGVGGNEGIFVACTFWLVELLALQGRFMEAQQYYDRALSCRNDHGLFSEEFDPKKKELLGNFPQALSHLAHINATLMLHRGPSAVQQKDFARES